ncbi:MAG: peptidylprolyl isomerase [Rhizobiaceae bacterium]
MLVATRHWRSLGLAVGLSLALLAGAHAEEDKVVATVNGQPITESELKIAITDLDPQFARLPAEQQRAAALSALIELRVMADEAVAKGLDKDPDFQLRMAMLNQRALHSEVVDKEVSKSITDEEIRARYDKEIAAQPPENEVHARHILVKTKEEADDIIKQLDGGADFEKLAGEKTEDPSGKTSGGDLGYFGAGQMVPEFEKAAFALEPGSYTKEPVQSQFGWHVIKVEDKRAKQPPAFDDVKEQLRNVVLREKYFELAKKLRAEAKVDIADADLKKALEPAPAAADEKPAEEPAKAQ